MINLFSISIVRSNFSVYFCYPTPFTKISCPWNNLLPVSSQQISIILFHWNLRPLDWLFLFSTVGISCLLGWCSLSSVPFLSSIQTNKAIWKSNSFFKPQQNWIVFLWIEHDIVKWKIWHFHNERLECSTKQRNTNTSSNNRHQNHCNETLVLETFDCFVEKRIWIPSRQNGNDPCHSSHTHTTKIHINCRKLNNTKHNQFFETVDTTLFIMCFDFEGD